MLDYAVSEIREAVHVLVVHAPVVVVELVQALVIDRAQDHAITDVEPDAHITALVLVTAALALVIMHA